MAGENQLFKIDTIVVDGIALPFEDGSGSLEGAAGWENTVVHSASGDDFTSRKRIPRMFKTKLLFGNAMDPAAFAKMKNVQIAARDSQSGRRCVMTRCVFSSMGSLGGGGPVDITFSVLSAPQWQG